MNETGKVWAIILAGGQGKRMQADIPKQYLLLQDKPILYYSIKAFEDSSVDSIVLVCAAGEEKYCQGEIVDKYGFKKVRQIVAGGLERYHSVYNGLQVIDGADYVLIHDGARPLVTIDIIERNIEYVKTYSACVTAMPSKDTVKISDENEYVAATLDRNNVWTVQTPQSFSFPLIKNAYEQLINQNMMGITDDAMVVEKTVGCHVKFVEGSYINIKITTPEDLKIAAAIISK